MSVMTLCQARELAGITQSELDRLAGLRKGTTQQIEAGRNKRPAYETVVRITRGLRRAGLAGISAEKIFPIPDEQEGAAPDESAA
jgi:transcriptional regulator with XRE-family HTH domain